MPEVIINGPAGRLEGRYHQNDNPKSPVILLLHPHPLYGGTMNNKVVYSLYRRFVENGFSVLRINFRGVGKSQGKFDNGAGELLDATAAVNWLHDQNMEASEYWIAGFSFGAWIALQTVMRRPELENYILVAPPASKYDFNFIVPCTSAGLVIQGGKDEITKESDSAKLAEKLAARDGADVIYQAIHGADHFFKDHLKEFEEVVDKHIKHRLVVDSTKVRKVKRDRRRRRKKKNISEVKPERNHFPVKSLAAFEA
ncbi:MAG: alpha/beta hydrolase [Alphaproteobacteria bacterium RIFCSPLOWO2_01_FULL_40_26]|nr:MAG: alpha/beta hydrolase [Alphaproteobacteria bacterium RIFCSPHIGHO2_02_FULL_40_34]OFW86869.1 MAG: alpha/beta hydrolase [Alphaproteobacteria bacterium RIFCSPHIGHO2_01_FULL_40_8]OFW93918.1 MAG: alpha/beta hydrolase [Alphaproteobacteria bacterium RIFCSPLOWO2_01_FULL_40_26]OFX09412.1 MAG: alpha/beta hydrolase [Alphaproteobacteria bacterium RIFCSPLOWO2_02_FULL_40_19]OFX11971.1 MAG: alpha/beta hydrolase [Alphaproteobacteria bacterium RIFCSPLOWO2_12_FULL_40_11]